MECFGQKPNIEETSAVECMIQLANSYVYKLEVTYNLETQMNGILWRILL